MCAPGFGARTLAKSIQEIATGLSRIYQWHLLNNLRDDLRRKMKLVDVGLGLELDELSELNTFFKFDDRVSGPMNDFDGAEDYHAKPRSDTLLNYVSVPALIINARNDPFVPAHLIPDKHDISDHVMLEISDNGGHLGFVSGRWSWAPRFWLDTRVPEFLASFLTTQGSF